MSDINRRDGAVGRFVSAIDKARNTFVDEILGHRPTVYITMEGGLCQGVSSDDPALIGADYVIIDYDSEGSDDVTAVRQSDGSISEAVIGAGTIDKLEVEIALGHVDESGTAIPSGWKLDDDLFLVRERRPGDREISEASNGFTTATHVYVRTSQQAREYDDH